ncbi:ATP-dependent DNA helicase Q1, partial [Fragariocoptes setiger]
MSSRREVEANNLRRLRTELEQIDETLKLKTIELRELRKKRKDVENKITSLSTLLQNSSTDDLNEFGGEFESEAFNWSSKVDATLKDVFKLEKFRPLQRTVINCTLSNKDCIYVAATGSGKSLVFQLPALISKGITIVVSPLLSLMEDQLTQLQELGINAVILNSSTDKETNKMAMQAMLDYNSPLKMIYVTPEKLAKSKLLMAQIEKMYHADRFSRLVIDEVHCCSQWGHDFRKDYKYLSIFKRQFPNTPILGLTATATNEVILDLQQILNIEGCYVFKGSFYRPNLKYEIVHTSIKDHTPALIELINCRFTGQTGIVYCLTIKDTEEVASKLNAAGIKCYPYHAQLTIPQRTKIQQLWYTNRCRVIVATIAFGLGINKTDVRFIVHFSISKSLENYYQETGRAGRDGNLAHCVCFYRFADVFRATALTFTEKTGQRHVYQMLAYCLNKRECRKQLIADHFEDYLKKDINDRECCDNCCDNNSVSSVDVRPHLDDILKILNHAQSVKEKLTQLKLIDSWTQTGCKNLRVASLTKPSLSRVTCETIVALLLIDGYLREDFHITPYSTISYLAPGPRSQSRPSRIEYDVTWIENFSPPAKKQKGPDVECFTID